MAQAPVASSIEDTGAPFPKGIHCLANRTPKLLGLVFFFLPFGAPRSVAKKSPKGQAAHLTYPGTTTLSAAKIGSPCLGSLFPALPPCFLLTPNNTLLACFLSQQVTSTNSSNNRLFACFLGSCHGVLFMRQPDTPIFSLSSSSVSTSLR